jgi:hypothetical protein
LAVFTLAGSCIRQYLDDADELLQTENTEEKLGLSPSQDYSWALV